MAQKKVKVHPQIRVMNDDLQDLIRHEIYGSGRQGKHRLHIKLKSVKKIAERVAMRAVVGH